MPQPPTSVLDAAQALTGVPANQVRDDGLWLVQTGHDAAEALARELRATHRESGWWPLLVHETDVEWIWEASELAEVPIGAEAVAGIVEGDLEQLLAPYAEDVVLPTAVDPKFSEPGPIDQVGDVEWLGLLLVPCRRPWESLPFVGFGAFDACPEPVEQGAVARWLYDEHGSDPIAVGESTVVFRSLRPVAPEVLTSTLRILMSWCTELCDPEIDPDELAGLLSAGVSRLGLWWD